LRQEFRRQEFRSSGVQELQEWWRRRFGKIPLKSRTHLNCKSEYQPVRNSATPELLLGSPFFPSIESALP
jgi:hypothetical protein